MVMLQKKAKRVLSVLMTLAMVLGLSPAAAFAAQAPEITDGVGTVDIAMMHESKDQLSMCDPMFDAKADVVVSGDNAELKVKVANPVPGFADQGADGTVKNVKITYNGQQYEAVSELGTDAVITAKADNTLFGLTAGEQYSAQVLTFNLPKEALEEDALVTDAYVNVVMMTDVTFRMQLTNLALEAPAEPDVKPEPEPKPEITEGVGTVDIAMMHESKDQLSMCDPMFDAKADVVVSGDNAELKVKVANPVPGFADQGADGTVKNVVITYNGQQYEAVSELGTDAVITAKADNTLFGLTAGEQYSAQVLTFNLPKDALAEDALVTDAYVNVVMMTDVTFRMQLTNLALEAPAEPDVKPEPEPKPEITEGVGTVDIAMLHESKDQPSMCDVMFDAKADVVVKGDNAELKVKVVNPVPGFADQGADGTVKNVKITYNGQQYEAVSELGTDAVITAKDTNALFGLEKGKQYPAQVLTFNLPKDALAEDALVTDAYVNVVMMTDVVFRMQLTNLALEAPAKPEITEGVGTVDVAMMHEYRDQPSMCDVMFDAKADVVVKGDNAELKVKVVNPVPGFADQGADGTVKNVKITYNGQQYEAVSELGTDAVITAKDTNALFGLEKGKQYPAQVLTFNLPKEALAEDALVTDAYVNVVMMTDVVFRMQLSNLVLEAAPDEAVTPESFKVQFLGKEGRVVWSREIKGYAGLFAPILYRNHRLVTWETEDAEGLVMRPFSYIDARMLTNNYEWHETNPVITFTIAK